jgi:hypothetical protein
MGFFEAGPGFLRLWDFRRQSRSATDGAKTVTTGIL